MKFCADNLLTGICIVIDDAFINDESGSDDIFKIIKQIEDKNIPIIKFHKLPINAIKQFRNVNFILLDWELTELETSIAEPITIPTGLRAENTKSNIEFIKSIQSMSFVPIFIFTKENVDEIINILVDAGLYNREKMNIIFVKSKSELKNKGELFSSLSKWLKETPSVYVLKEWENCFNNAKRELFWDLYALNPDWPKLLWKAYKQDEVDMAVELGDTITRNLVSRISQFCFDNDILSRDGYRLRKEDLITVLSGDRFIPTKNLNKKNIYTGDIYKSENGKYYLNIRPQCDLISRDGKNSDAIILYLLEGECINFPNSRSEMKRYFNSEGGNFKEAVSEAFLFPIEGSIIKISFKTHINKKYGSMKSKRIGRILPPYITRIQQRYALYLQREGIPRTPEQAIYDNHNGVNR